MLKSLWLPNTSGGCIVGALGENQMVNTDNNSILRTCKNFYSNLVILPLIAPLEYLKNFKLDSTTEDSLFMLLENVEVTKAACIDQISGKFWEDRARILGKMY